MGCDIHLFTEKKVSINGVDTWVNCDDWRLNPYYDGSIENGRQYEHHSLYQGRNYELFGILANVRGYCEKVISDPRGLPSGVSEIVKIHSDHWGIDGHSHSHFTLRELTDYLSENPTISVEGMIPPEAITKLEETGEVPTMSAGFSTMEGWDYRTWEEESPLARLVVKITKRLKDEFYIFDDEKIKEFDEKIRIVFWFDN